MYQLISVSRTSGAGSLCAIVLVSFLMYAHRQVMAEYLSSAIGWVGQIYLSFIYVSACRYYLFLIKALLNSILTGQATSAWVRV